MLAAASTLDVDLLSTDSIGDPACSCGLFSRVRVDLEREPQLFVGGDGSSDDNNNGTAFPTIPLGGAIFGPQPCAAPDRSPLFTGNFFQALGVGYETIGELLQARQTGVTQPVNPDTNRVPGIPVPDRPT